MGNLVMDGRMLVLLKTLRDQLDENPRASMGALPEWMPDGSSVKTIEQVAVMMGVDSKTAALAVLQAKVAPVSLRIEAKDVFASSGSHTVGRGIGTVIHRARTVQRKKPKRKKPVKALHAPDESSYSNGVCVMLEIGMQETLAWPGGTKPEDLHITVCWYGDKDEMEMPREAFTEALQNIADRHEDFFAAANGITRFSTPDSNGRDPIVLNMDAKEIEQLRHEVCSALGYGASEHGYTPHTTLGYIDADDPMPIQRFNPLPVLVTGIILAWGSEKEVFKFKPMGSGSEENGE